MPQDARQDDDDLSSTKPFVPGDESAAAGTPGHGVPDAYPDLDVKGEIGHGGMGTVFLAREKSANRDVALKVLAADRDRRDRKDRTRFLEEAHVTAQLQHPGIVPVYRIGEGAQGRPYYTMRPIEGRTLRAILDDLRQDDPSARDRFGLRRLVQVFQSVCQAVRFAHDRGVIHRDLKPSNVVVGEYGEVLVIDWGLAKAVSPKGDEAPARETGDQAADRGVWELYERRVVSLREDDVVTLQATVAGSVMGTPAYMSPEQILGNVRELGGRSDVWSLGVMLYELCTLKRPFEGKDLAELTAQITTTDPSDPITVNPQRRVPPELRDIILSCLKREKTERYDSVADLLTDIEHWLEGVAPWRLIADVDFSRLPDGEPEGWTCIKGRWRVSNGTLASIGDLSNNLFLDEDVTGDVRVEVEARVIEAPKGEITVMLCAPDSGAAMTTFYSAYFLQFGAESNTAAAVQRTNVHVATTQASYVPGQWHTVVAEKTADLLRLTVDGREILHWPDPEPLSGPRTGLYGYGSGLRVRRFRLFSRGLPLMISCLAVPDAFYEEGLMEKARALYLGVGANHPVREEGLQALFRAGKCSLALAGAETEPVKRQHLLDEAWGLFGRIEGSPLGPLACLGKSLVHAFRGEVEKEADELERAYRDYRGWEGLAFVGERLWERTGFFRPDRIRSALFGMPALRFHPVGMSTAVPFSYVDRLPDVTLVTERLMEYMRNSSSALHRELARDQLVRNWLFNGLWDRAETEIQERLGDSEGLALFHALAELAILRGRQRRCEEELTVYRRIERDWPADRQRLFHALSQVVSVCGTWLGRYDEAEETARRIFAEWPASDAVLAVVHLHFGWALFLQGRYEEAEREWRHIIREWPTTAVTSGLQARVGLCWLAMLRGARDEAIGRLEEAYETWRDRGSVLDALRAQAIVHALTGRGDEVLKALERSAEVYPDYAARAALHPDDADAVAAWRLWSPQFKADGQLVEGLLAYARGEDAPAVKLLTESLEDPHTYLSSFFDWPVRRLIEKLETQD